MKRRRCERCRWRSADHVLVVTAPDGRFFMHSCEACWPELERAAAQVVIELEGTHPRG